MPSQCLRPNYNGRSLDKSLDISVHCPSMCRADLTKWLDENAPTALVIKKRDPQKGTQIPSDDGYVREMVARVQVRAPNIVMALLQT